MAIRAGIRAMQNILGMGANEATDVLARQTSRVAADVASRSGQTAARHTGNQLMSQAVNNVSFSHINDTVQSVTGHGLGDMALQALQNQGVQGAISGAVLGGTLGAVNGDGVISGGFRGAMYGAAIGTAYGTNSRFVDGMQSAFGTENLGRSRFAPQALSNLRRNAPNAAALDGLSSEGARYGRALQYGQNFDDAATSLLAATPGTQDAAKAMIDARRASSDMVSSAYDPGVRNNIRNSLQESVFFDNSKEAATQVLDSIFGSGTTSNVGSIFDSATDLNNARSAAAAAAGATA